MQNFTRFLFILLLCISFYDAQSQTRRYLDQVFSEVEVSNLVPMGQNYTILNWIATQGQANTLRQPLVGQFYTPKGDTRTDRPLVIYLHTGNFFPYPANGSCSGTLRDSSNVEIATRLAKMGYVVAVVNYRQGWNPFDPNELIRRFFLINAAYRGVQDVSTYVRYFRRSVAEFGNIHGIDPNKITVWGQGTGGYLSLAAAYLNTYNEILTTSDPKKFILPTPIGELPMVLEQYNGNIDATGPITTVDATYAALSQLKIGDTLCIPNHPGYSSDFALCVNMGGALGDSTWLDAGEAPLISFHVTTDPFAPCKTNVLNVPTPLGPQPVLEVSGSCDLAPLAEAVGLNNVFKTIPPIYDPYGSANPSGFPGFYEFKNTPDNTSSPWEWAAADNPPSTCNKSAIQAKTYIDTIIGYFAPRACVALGLNCDFAASNKEINEAAVNLKMAPNPAHFDINFSVAAETPIRSISVYDISGRMLRHVSNINSSEYTLRRDQLQDGMYIVRMEFEKGLLSKKVVFN